MSRLGHRGLGQPHLGFRQRELPAALTTARPRGLEPGQGAFTDQLPFELGQRREDAEHEAAGRGGGAAPTLRICARPRSQMKRSPHVSLPTKAAIADLATMAVRTLLSCHPRMLPKRSNNCSLRRANRSDWILQDPRQYLDHSARQHCAREECPGSRRSCHRNIECPGRGPFASATVSSAFPAVKPLPGRP